MVFYIENALGASLGVQAFEPLSVKPRGHVYLLWYICYGIFVMLLFSLYFICLNFASFLIAYLSASICFLNSTTHDKGPEI